MSAFLPAGHKSYHLGGIDALRRSPRVHELRSAELADLNRICVKKDTLHDGFSRPVADGEKWPGTTIRRKVNIGFCLRRGGIIPP